MKRVLFFLLGWILIVILIDVGTTYYAFHNKIPVEETGILRTSDYRSTDATLVFHLGYTFLILSFSFWLIKKYYDNNHQILLFKIFVVLLVILGLTSTGVAINNIAVITQFL